jgi:hypothetical protein
MGLAWVDGLSAAQVEAVPPTEEGFFMGEEGLFMGEVEDLVMREEGRVVMKSTFGVKHEATDQRLVIIFLDTIHRPTVDGGDMRG